MTRYLLVRQGTTEDLVEETALPLEKDLHDVLTDYPELVPAEDLGLGRMVVVGRESGLASGYADLVLLDEHGQLCLVEVKKEKNPDTRRVVAQLLDYAARLWGMTTPDFERQVLHPHLRRQGYEEPLPSLAEFLDTEFPQSGKAAGESALDRALPDNVEQALATGDFALVVAAPVIPESVQRALEYLNARGLRFFALEISYFKGPAECFVPRLVVMPRIADRGSAKSESEVMDRETYLESVPESIRQRVEEFLVDAQSAGAQVVWNKGGAGLRVTRQQTRSVGLLEANRMLITITQGGDFPQEPFDEVRVRLASLRVGGPSSDGKSYVFPWKDASPDIAAAALGAFLQLVRELVLQLPYVVLEPPVKCDFARNDHNVWVKQVPALKGLLGRQLLGELVRASTGAEAGVTLVPLATGQPGWKPLFAGSSEQSAVWPPIGESEESYEVTIRSATAV